MMDYTIFYKSKPAKETEIATLGNWDIFISAFNQTDRVNKVFEKIEAKSKCWIVHSEYGFEKNQVPLASHTYYSNEDSESESIKNFFNFVEFSIEDLKKSRICIDSTGFLRPHLMFLILYFYTIGVSEFDVLYSEPSHYVKKEKTEFSIGSVEEVRFVHGFGGTNNRDTSGDLLIVGAGFDNDLILEVVASKEHARKIQIVGFPSLQADMYQQCRLRTYQGADTASAENSPYFAPANDPFVTATVISKLVNKKNKEKTITNLYLSPLSTKAQTIGFVLFFIGECINGKKDGGIIFPVSKSYSKETSKGISKTWAYHIEFPLE